MERCPDFGACGWVRQHLSRGRGLRIYQHAGLTLPAAPAQLRPPAPEFVLIDEAFLGEPVCVVEFPLVRYRRRGQGGSEARALVRAGLTPDQIRAALEALGGPLASLALVAEPARPTAAEAPVEAMPVSLADAAPIVVGRVPPQVVPYSGVRMPAPLPTASEIRVERSLSLADVVPIIGRYDADGRPLGRAFYFGPLRGLLAAGRRA